MHRKHCLTRSSLIRNLPTFDAAIREPLDRFWFCQRAILAHRSECFADAIKKELDKESPECSIHARDIIDLTRDLPRGNFFFSNTSRAFCTQLSKAFFHTDEPQSRSVHPGERKIVLNLDGECMMGEEHRYRNFDTLVVYSRTLRGPEWLRNPHESTRTFLGVWKLM